MFFPGVIPVSIQFLPRSLGNISMPSQKAVYVRKKIDGAGPVCVPCVEICPPTSCVLQVSFVSPYSMCPVYLPKTTYTVHPSDNATNTRLLASQPIIKPVGEGSRHLTCITRTDSAFSSLFSSSRFTPQKTKPKTIKGFHIIIVSQSRRD